MVIQTKIKNNQKRNIYNSNTCILIHKESELIQVAAEPSSDSFGLV